MKKEVKCKMLLTFLKEWMFCYIGRYAPIKRRVRLSHHGCSKKGVEWSILKQWKLSLVLNSERSFGLVGFLAALQHRKAICAMTAVHSF
jgi:hypothetical protein